jgi:hypothetical protein
MLATMTTEEELPGSSRGKVPEAAFASRSAAAQARVIRARADLASGGRGSRCRSDVEDAVMEYLGERRRTVS